MDNGTCSIPGRLLLTSLLCHVDLDVRLVRVVIEKWTQAQVMIITAVQDLLLFLSFSLSLSLSLLIVFIPTLCYWCLFAFLLIIPPSTVASSQLSSCVAS